MAYSSEAVAGTAQTIAFLRYEPRGLPPARYGRLIVAVGFNPREDAYAYAPRVASRRLNIRVSSPAMANTFSQVYLHLVFSTKDRVDLIAPEIEQRVWSYMGGVAKKHGMTPLQIGGTDNHAHALIGVPTSISPAEAAKYIKGDSSKWLRAELIPNFGWQDVMGHFPYQSLQYSPLRSTSRTNGRITRNSLSRTSS